MFTYQRTLTKLDPTLVNGLPAAVENAERLSGEIVELIRSLNGRAAA